MLTEIALGLQGCLRLGGLKDDGAAPVELTSILDSQPLHKALKIAQELPQEIPEGPWLTTSVNLT